jgi:hypothetical protein
MRGSRFALLLAGLVLLAPAATAGTLAPALAGIGFLIGSWTGGDGKVVDAGETSTGSSHITAQAGGAVLLRQDHTELFDKSGHPIGGFDILMTIYAEAGALHADYFDGTHIIHYTAAQVVPGKSVTFLTAIAPDRPAFRLSYTREGSILTVAFAIEPPGQTRFSMIATGTLHRQG